ncbi:putative RING-H2 finger protein atl21a [Phtheirospermum japonicum]|uniref:RING-type E3 ubiquitin transferase n=1 Tax=Phtheirospermum japonicum TaxID=374723 RepID=A0A830CCH7_9LAMI|nr:putative RING-H2 finger protein atl21a [Phtheirospermum japonicum]
MGIQNFLILLLLSVAHSQNSCPNSYCDKNAQFVQFPFWIQGQQPENCGLPGFNLTCDAQKRPVLKLPNSGEFYVKPIYYNIQRVTLVDPDNCLPRRLLSLNLSSSPFKAASYENYTFFSCPKGQVYSGTVLSCLGNATNDVLAASYQEDYYVRLVPKCKKIATLQVPVSSFFRVGFPVELELTWDVSTCRRCGSAIGGE